MFIRHARNIHSTDLLSSNYGIDEDGPVPSSDLERVVVPRNPLSLDDDHFAALQNAVDPLDHSNNYGI